MAINHSHDQNAAKHMLKGITHVRYTFRMSTLPFYCLRQMCLLFLATVQVHIAAANIR
jgi:hypothetical protein